MSINGAAASFVGAAAARLITYASEPGPPDALARRRARATAGACRVVVRGGPGRCRVPRGGLCGQAGDAQAQPAGRFLGPQSEERRRPGTGAIRVLVAARA